MFSKQLRFFNQKSCKGRLHITQVHKEHNVDNVNNVHNVDNNVENVDDVNNINVDNREIKYRIFRSLQYKVCWESEFFKVSKNQVICSMELVLGDVASYIFTQKELFRKCFLEIFLKP